MARCWLIFFSLLLLPGCALKQQTSSPSVISNIKNAAEDRPQPGVAAFQYATPWDKAMFDGFSKQIKSAPDVGEVKGGVVPHHLVAGYIPATFFNYLARQDPSTIVLLSPNHLFKGDAAAISTKRDWQTPYGMVKTDKKIVDQLAQESIITIDEEAISTEHGLNSLVSFASENLPGTKLISIMLRYQSPTSSLDKLVSALQKFLPDDAVVVSSVDFSHYLPAPVADFHDELSRTVIKKLDFDRLNKLEVDSIPSLYVLLKLMDVYKTTSVVYELADNSARLLNNLESEETTSYYSPWFVRSGKQTIPAPESASLLFFGDMMLDRNVKTQIDKYGTDYLFKKLAGRESRFFKGIDIISANLEGPFADQRRSTSKSIAFRFDPQLIPLLQKYNFSLFSQANNHSYDMGADGFAESKQNLSAAGIDFYGSQYKIGEESVLIKKVGELKIAFVGFNDTNTPLDAATVANIVKKAGRGSNLVVVNIHWGEEYKTISNQRQRTLARILIDAGADLIIGHHPHVIQEMEIYKNRPIFYSLGNFIFDQYFSAPTQLGLAVGAVLSKQSASIYIFPLTADKSQPRLMNFTEAAAYLDDWIKDSRLGERQFNNFNLKLDF